MNSTSQIVAGMKESTGVDLQALLAGIAGGKRRGREQLRRQYEGSIIQIKRRSIR